MSSKLDSMLSFIDGIVTPLVARNSMKDGYSLQFLLKTLLSVVCSLCMLWSTRGFSSSNLDSLDTPINAR